MSFDTCDKVLGAGFFRLENDGDKEIIVLLGEPMERKSTFQGKSRWQACFPVLTDDGPKIWTMGSRLYVRIRDAWKTLLLKPLQVVRHGKKGSTETVYDIKILGLNEAWRKRLKKVDMAEVTLMLTTAAASTTGDDVEHGEMIP